MTVIRVNYANKFFEKASNNCNDEEVKFFAANLLPSLKKHSENSITCQKNCEKNN